MNAMLEPAMLIGLGTVAWILHDLLGGTPGGGHPATTQS
jgi:hypothetical protein